MSPIAAISGLAVAGFKRFACAAEDDFADTRRDRETMQTLGVFPVALVPVAYRLALPFTPLLADLAFAAFCLVILIFWKNGNSESGEIYRKR